MVIDITSEWIPGPKEIPEELLRTANEWWARLTAASYIEELWPAFEHWVESDPLHELAWSALEVTCEALTDLGLLRRALE